MSLQKIWGKEIFKKVVSLCRDIPLFSTVRPRLPRLRCAASEDVSRKIYCPEWIQNSIHFIIIPFYYEMDQICKLLTANNDVLRKPPVPVMPDSSKQRTRENEKEHYRISVRDEARELQDSIETGLSGSREARQLGKWQKWLVFCQQLLMKSLVILAIDATLVSFIGRGQDWRERERAEERMS